MSSTGGVDRRGFVKRLGVVGSVVAVAGCGDGGNDGDGDGDPTSTGTPTDTPTETPTETVPEGESLSGAVSAVNETIASVNEGETSLASLNEGLENVDPVAPIDPVEAETADAAGQEAQRLRDEADRVVAAIVDKVPREINAQAGPLTLVDEETVETVQDLRDQAEEVGNDDASQALTDAADLADYIREELNAAADRLESAGD